MYQRFESTDGRIVFTEDKYALMADDGYDKFVVRLYQSFFKDMDHDSFDRHNISCAYVVSDVNISTLPSGATVRDNNSYCIPMPAWNDKTARVNYATNFYSEGYAFAIRFVEAGIRPESKYTESHLGLELDGTEPICMLVPSDCVHEQKHLNPEFEIAIHADLSANSRPFHTEQLGSRELTRERVIWGNISSGPNEVAITPDLGPILTELQSQSGWSESSPVTLVLIPIAVGRGLAKECHFDEESDDYECNTDGVYTGSGYGFREFKGQNQVTSVLGKSFTMVGGTAIAVKLIRHMRSMTDSLFSLDQGTLKSGRVVDDSLWHSISLGVLVSLACVICNEMYYVCIACYMLTIPDDNYKAKQGQVAIQLIEIATSLGSIVTTSV
jgi:hypothetical protein